MGEDASIVAEVVFRCLLYIIGCIGNLLVIFFILILREHKKVTHWYVLQLALADFVCLQTLPFRISEVLNEDWVYPVWACNARQTVFFINYYTSIIFLMIMGVDRYLAVCHSFSSVVQKLRSNKAVAVVTGCVWSVSLLLCIPVMMYSDVVGANKCSCSLSFPLDAKMLCKQIGDDSDACVQNYSNAPACIRLASTDYGSGEENSSSRDYDNYSSEYEYEYYETNYSSESSNVTTSEGETTISIEPQCQFRPEEPGMHIFVYFNFIAMFLVPLLVIAICYLLISLRLSRTMAAGPRKTSTADPSSTDGSNHTGKSQRPRSKSVVSNKSQREKKRVTVMCVVLVSLFVICWLPFHAVNVALVEGIKNQSSQTCRNLSKFAAVFAYLNSAINPYLYNFLGSFKKKLRQVKKTSTVQSFLSATGMTRMGGGVNENVSSSSGFTSMAHTRRSTAQNAHSAIPEEGIPLDETKNFGMR